MPETDTRPVIFGTAGHIDHGKTTLTERLTGVNTDRLPEERNRGISIDLGFAHFELPSGRHAALIDVPGHEKFIRNMAAGVHGMDAVMLVVAADEGIMPQTREHLDILTLLGVQRGLTVITKADLVEPEWLPIVDDTVKEALMGSFLEKSPRIFVDSVSGRGIDELLQALDQLAKQVPGRDAGGVVRLPIDRVFSVRGFGTVVTGTLISGTIQDEMSLEITPGGQIVRVRGLEVHGHKVGKAVAGQRVAVNLSGLEKEFMHRGQVLSEPGTIKAHDVMVGELTLLSTSPVLAQRARVHIHLGTAEVTGRLYWYDRDELQPKAMAFAEMRLESALPATRGDRFLIRSYSPMTTIGGGRIIEVGRHHKKKEPGLMDFLSLASAGDSEGLVRAVLSHATRPIDVEDIAWQSGLSVKEVAGTCERITDVLLGSDGLVLQQSRLQPFSNQLLEFLRHYHRNHPLRRGIEREKLRETLWPSWSVKQALFVVVHTTGATIAGEWVRLTDFAPSAPEPWQSEIDLIYRAIQDYGLKPLTIDLLREQLRIDTDHFFDVMEFLTQQGRIVRLDEGIYLADIVFEHARRNVTEALRSGAELSTSQLREVLGANRRFTVLVLELLDSLHVTRRVGDNRTLVKGQNPAEG
ncbi:MAG: selenocysteine-specific translation elongation factor [Firmicutes bacterium]|nr:selenocysteine-specific translation elongation factor [Bacillota bacterium]